MKNYEDPCVREAVNPMVEVVDPPVNLGILGYNLSHSISPAIHQAGVDHREMQVNYLKFDVPPEKLSDAVRGMAALGFRGCNVTIPYKEDVIQLAHITSCVVDFIGAANTLTFRDGEIVADNTDWNGFLDDWKYHQMGQIKDREAVILGSGGGAYGVLFALLEEGLASARIFNRDVVRARRMFDRFRSRYPHLKGEAYFLSDTSSLRKCIEQGDILVNATPVGQFPYIDTLPIPRDVKVSRHMRVYDLVYNPRSTRLIEQMRTLGVRAEGGLGMLLFQAARSFELWTGQKPDMEKMRVAAMKALES